MIATQPRPRPPRFGPAQKRWTVAEFHRVFAAPDLKVERPYLVHGVIWEQGPMNAPHANAVDTANETLRAIFSAGYRVRVQSALVFGLETDPQTDIAVVRGDLTTYKTKHPSTAALVVEVSDTTLFEDSTTKAELYATAGIPEYWIIDLNANVLKVLRDPQPIAAGGVAHRTVLQYGPGDTVASLAEPERPIRIADLLP